MRKKLKSYIDSLFDFYLLTDLRIDLMDFVDTYEYELEVILKNYIKKFGSLKNFS